MTSLIAAITALLVYGRDPAQIEAPRRSPALVAGATASPGAAPAPAPTGPTPSGSTRSADDVPAAEAMGAWIETALDLRASLDARSDAVRALAPLAGEAAFSALERLLADEGSGPLAAVVVEALGSSPHPRAFERLAALAASPDATLASAALRGLARSSRPEAVELLAHAIADAARPGALRVQAIESLAGLPFARSADALRGLLASPHAPPALEVAILEALADSTPDAAGLLLEAAASAPRPEARATALASLGELESAGDALAFAAPLLASERDPRVRGKLYDVLAFAAPSARSQLDAAELSETVLAEDDASARLRGARLLARLLAEREDAALARTFDAELVPWLAEAARGQDAGLAARAAVDTLASAGTPAAGEALGRLAHASDSRLAQAAARAAARRERAQAGG